MKLFHSRTQHAVGQGGFHTACIDDGETVLRYAYDCGSTNTNRLAECIAEFAEESDKLDLLFLSHLDTDHSNGVDKLLDFVKVETVVLPYLSPFERLVLVAEVVASPAAMTTANSLLTMLARPVGWFRRRGVERVVFVRGPEGDATAAPPIAPDVRPPSEGDGHRPATPPDDGPLAVGLPPLAIKDEQRTEMGVRPADKIDIGVMSSKGIPVKKAAVTVWSLAPFVHPEPLRVDAFRDAVATLLGFATPPSADDPKWLSSLRRALRDRRKRRDLADLYTKHVRKDRNLSSMALYSGPSGPTPTRTTSINIPPFSWRTPTRNGEARVGWIGTGDAHLDQKKRRAEFERFYRPVFDTVGTMMLPHHGSRHNIKSALIQEHEDMTWIAAHGIGNSYGHPDRHLVRVASTYGTFVPVTERRRSVFVQSAALEWPVSAPTASQRPSTGGRKFSYEDDPS